MYVAVKGGEKAIRAAHALQEQKRRGDGRLPELSVEQISDQLSLAVDRVMTEGGIADRELAALALKQASGDNVEAIFLLRAYRTTLPRLAVSEPINTAEMRLERRISAVYKDIPGGQLLGPTYDYTHRLLDFTLLANGEAPSVQQADGEAEPTPHVFSLLTQQGLAKTEEDRGTPPDDITRTPPVYPCSRSSRLQQLMRGDEGYLLALAYSTQRGYGRNHPFAGEIRSGYVQVEIVPEELGFSVNIGELLLTECEMVNGFVAPQEEPPSDGRHSSSAQESAGEASKAESRQSTPIRESSKEASSGSSNASERETVTCTFSIDCKNAVGKLPPNLEAALPSDGVILDSVTVTCKKNETVLSALKRICKERNIAVESDFSGYVRGIAQLYEKDCGANSGWMYSVNGVFPGVGAGGYRLKEGDSVVWRYTCEYGDTES